MGAWGHRAWESDGARLFVEQALLGDWPPSSWPLYAVPDDAGLSSSSWMACEVVAACAGRPHPELPEEVAGWVAANEEVADRGLVDAAREVMAELVEDSELRDLFEDDPAWLGEARGLMERLGSVALDGLPERGDWEWAPPPVEVDVPWDDPSWGEPAEHWGEEQPAAKGFDVGMVLAAVVVVVLVVAVVASL